MHGDALTISGETIAESLTGIPSEPLAGQDVIRPWLRTELDAPLFQPIEAQAEQVLKNLAAVLTAGGASLGHVVRTTIFLTSMNDFAAVNEVYGKHFAAHKPARATVAVKELPKGALVEIDCIAAL